MSEEKAMRFNEGKLQWSLVDFDSLEDMVRVLEFGAKKYSVNNWKKPMSTVKIIESMLRHTFFILKGELIDQESKLPHVAHIQCNAMFLAYHLKKNKKFQK